MIVYEILKRCVPYQGISDLAISKLVQNDSTREKQLQLPQAGDVLPAGATDAERQQFQDLVNLMRCCLQTQPAQRPTFNDIVQQLHAIRGATPLSSPFPSSSTPGVSMSLSEFEAAVGDQSAARHAYLDSLQAALPACEVGQTRAIDESDYNEAEMFSAIAKTIRAILSGIEKPVSKADIRASLDGGIFEAP
jgi:hypothetical protein